jgi:CheY-like chemotaxis protein
MCGPDEVLVVDRNPVIRAVLRAMLRHGGLKCWTAANAREAVETYLAHRPSIGVVVVDVTGDRWGPDPLEELRRLAPDLPCLLMTAGVPEEDDGRPLLPKPFPSPERLASLLRGVMRSAATGALAGA